MNYLKSVTVYYWSTNHIAFNITQTNHTFADGKFLAVCDEEGRVVHTEKFTLTHDSDPEKRYTSNYTPEVFKDLINIWFEGKKKKIPSFVDDFWEDCSLYIREDQIELLKSLYQIMLEYHALDDDYLLDTIKTSKQVEINTTSGSEKRVQSLVKAETHEALRPLIEKLREDKTTLEKKYIILDFVEQLKFQKGLSIDTENADEDSMYGKLPLKEWVLPLGNSLMLDNNDEYLEQLNLFGLNVKGIENGIKKFEDQKNIVYRGFNEIYFKFFSRYHNCAGYSRFLLEQGGITAFCSTNELEKFGVTNPSLFDAYMTKVQARITVLNEQARDLMRDAGVVPKPLKTINTNYLAEFKKKRVKIFDELPKAARNAINEYNKELVDVSYEYKIKLLANLVKILHSNSIKQPGIIDAIQKEVRRSYEINFDAQFSHNHSFQLKCLSSLAAISVGALAVGILAIAFPPLIPITLAAAVVITTVGTTSLAISQGLFTKKMQPERPSSKHSYSKDIKSNAVNENNELSTDQENIDIKLPNPAK
ncbi:hypothetical protein [Legionella sp.]|uniref:hypothetical protein n=1 Tax=Legionella sp. TaxID=459 RepID=UPI003CC2B388